jgi:biotin synthase
MSQTNIPRHDWSIAEVEALFARPFSDLMFQAQTVHREHFNPNEVQVSTLLSINIARKVHAIILMFKKNV